MVMTLRNRTLTDANDNTTKEEDYKADKTLKDSPPKDRTTLVVFIGLLIDLLAFTLILPLFPALIGHYRDNDSSGLFAYLETKVDGFRVMVGAPAQFNTVLFGGFLGSVFSFLQYLASPIIGGLSDRYGRKPLLLMSTVGIALSYLLWVFSSNFTIFVLARILGGISKGNVSLSTAIVTDVSTPSTRGRGMAMIGVAFSLGFLIGPMIGAAFSLWGKEAGGEWYVYPAIFALGLSVVDILFLFVFFKESLPVHKRSATSLVATAKSYIHPIHLFRFSSIEGLEKKEHSNLCQVGLAYFIYLFFYSGMEFTLTFLTHIRFGFTSMQQGKMFFFIGLLMAVLQGGVVRRLPLGSEQKYAMMGLLLIVPSFAIVGSAYSLPTLYLGLSLYAISTAFVVPMLSSLVSQYGGDHQKGAVMGVFRSLGALGRALGPAFGSLLFWSLGPEISYAVGGLLLLIPWAILRSVKN